ncbi:MAG TPA: M20/M25/M40 family metallo-hydrolase [Gemmatimonadetes bacterium]|nr:M20/M25/M40 family metallo-hydrolase [Gemmatimonadota bacterium]
MELSRALGFSEWQEDNVKMHSNTVVPHRTLPRPTKKLLLAVISCVIAAPISAQSGGDVARSYREAHEVEILKDFAELLSYPNRAQDLDDITRAAEYIRDELLEVGVDSELLQLEGVPPIVYGELNVPGATRTLGIYVHYDGQPVDPSNWTHPPFEPTLYTAPIPQGGRELPMPDPGDPIDPAWRLYARSAGDDKAPIAALLPVLRAFRESGTQSTSNLILFFDGEEEAGSRNLPRYMETFKERLDPIDIWLFFDGPAHPSGRPQITFGVRGSMGMEVTVYGATRNLHSGHYGNWAPDTGVILSRLLVSMKDETGRVLVDGWYDTADLIGDEERAALAAMPAWDNQLKRELGIVRSEGEPESLPQRLMVPALNIRGITSGNTGALARNVIPNTAVAALGIRLVKGNEPEHLRQLIIDHIQREGFHVISEDPDMETRLRYPLIAKVTGGGGSRAARTSMSNPFAQSVMAAASVAADRAFGQGSLVVAPGMGGTLPITPFTEILQKPAIIVPVANHDNNQHAPDENLRIANLWYAIDLYAQLLTMPATIF